jgi:hypothetical protein
VKCVPSVSLVHQKYVAVVWNVSAASSPTMKVSGVCKRGDVSD